MADDFGLTKDNGRPRKYKTVDELEEAIEVYFDECNSRVKMVYIAKEKRLVECVTPIPYTIEGLGYAIGLTRESLNNYQKKPGYEKFFDTIKKAKAKVQLNKMERGLEGDSQPAVTIFDLKNNHGYRDKQELAHTGDINITVDDGCES